MSMITVELDIEKDICDVLSSEISDYLIEPFSGDFFNTLERAKRQSNGMIVVAHSYDTAEYEFVSQNRMLVQLPYAINIMSNDQRGSAGVMEILDRIRTAMIGYKYDMYPAKIVNHQVDPTRFPDLETGVFRAELNISIRVDIAYLKTKLKVN